MKAMHRPRGDIDAVFASQHGVVSRAELVEIGVSDAVIRWALSRGKWEPMHRGVYRLSGSPNTWLQRVMAALLAAGPRAWVSHHSSAALHHLTGYPPGCIELTTMHRRIINGVIVHKTKRYPPFFPISVEGVTTADVNLTLLDLAAVDAIERVEEAMEDALARRLTSVRKLEWFLTRAAGRGVQGSTVLKKLLDFRLPGEEVPQSVMESRMDRLIRRGKLPRPVRQFSLRNESGREVARPDFAYPARKLGGVIVHKLNVRATVGSSVGASGTMTSSAATS
jgi:predicted transcriptional regulator of viral defense system